MLVQQEGNIFETPETLRRSGLQQKFCTDEHTHQQGREQFLIPSYTSQFECCHFLSVCRFDHKQWYRVLGCSLLVVSEDEEFSYGDWLFIGLPF